MNNSLFEKIKQWRDETAKKENVEFFRVLPNKTISDIAALEPKTKEELVSIKGIKERKFYKYGKVILDIIRSESKNGKIETSGLLFSDRRRTSACSPSWDDPLNDGSVNSREKIYTVSGLLDFLNGILIINEARVKGEVTSVDERERVVYFTLKDKEDNSALNCLIFRYQYEISGVNLEIGKEIIIDGFPEIYKLTGRLSFKASLIEIAGEGAIKKAYDELRKKLEKEGLFLPERKKPLPKLPQVIGLITSNQGAAIGDFITNIGKYGFKIKFINSSVEGKQAVFDLIKAVRIAKKISSIDVLAIIRGGGSLESLQAFNNESLVREIASLDIPVVCGVGHEKDISLVSLVSDLAVSTPTAAARAIRESWDKTVYKLEQNQKIIISFYEKSLFDSKGRIESASYALNDNFGKIFYKFKEIKKEINHSFQRISLSISAAGKFIETCGRNIFSEYERFIFFAKRKIKIIENQIKLNSPERQLKLGYSIVSFGGKIVRSIRQVKKGDSVNIKVSDGKIGSRVEKIE